MFTFLIKRYVYSPFSIFPSFSTSLLFPYIFPLYFPPCLVFSNFTFFSLSFFYFLFPISLLPLFFSFLFSFSFISPFFPSCFLPLPNFYGVVGGVMGGAYDTVRNWECCGGVWGGYLQHRMKLGMPLNFFYNSPKV